MTECDCCVLQTLNAELVQVDEVLSHHVYMREVSHINALCVMQAKQNETKKAGTP